MTAAMLSDTIKEAPCISMLSVTAFALPSCCPNNHLRICVPKSVICNLFPPNFCSFVPQHVLHPSSVLHTQKVLFSVSPNSCFANTTYALASCIHISVNTSFSQMVLKTLHSVNKLFSHSYMNFHALSDTSFTFLSHDTFILPKYHWRPVSHTPPQCCCLLFPSLNQYLLTIFNALPFLFVLPNPVKHLLLITSLAWHYFLHRMPSIIQLPHFHTSLSLMPLAKQKTVLVPYLPKHKTSLFSYPPPEKCWNSIWLCKKLRTFCRHTCLKTEQWRRVISYANKYNILIYILGALAKHTLILLYAPQPLTATCFLSSHFPLPTTITSKHFNCSINRLPASIFY